MMLKKESKPSKEEGRGIPRESQSSDESYLSSTTPKIPICPECHKNDEVILYTHEWKVVDGEEICPWNCERCNLIFDNYVKTTPKELLPISAEFGTSLVPKIKTLTSDNLTELLTKATNELDKKFPENKFYGITPEIRFIIKKILEEFISKEDLKKVLDDFEKDIYWQDIDYPKGTSYCSITKADWHKLRRRLDLETSHKDKVG